MKKRVILTAGGTGGHLFPAQAVAESLASDYEILFVGGGLATNPYFHREKFPFKEISTATFSLKNPLKALFRSAKITLGLLNSISILRKFKPDLVIGFGSFYTLPMLLAALACKVPYILHEQNTIPGKVNRLFSRFAKVTATTFPKSSSYLKGKNQMVQFPLRRPSQSFTEDSLDYFQLEQVKKTLLVFGGSQGALKISECFLEVAASLQFPVQVIHLTGDTEFTRKAKDFYRAHNISACVKDFEPRMDLAWKIADGAVTRAGAATLSELVNYEVPAIVIPFPRASENHQEYNGDFFVEDVGGGRMILEKELSVDILTQSLRALLGDEGSQWKQNICRYKSHQQLPSLVEVIAASL